MNNLEIISILEIAVFGMAIAQILLIALTIRRERDISELRNTVEQQRLSFLKLIDWAVGQAPKRTAPQDESYEPASDMTAPISEASLPKTRQPRTTEDDFASVERNPEWEEDVIVRLRSGIKAQQTTDGFKWFKDDPNEPPEIAEARRIVAGKAHPPEDRGSSANVTRISSRAEFTSVEVERTLAAIKSLREDADKASGLNGKVTTGLKQR